MAVHGRPGFAKHSILDDLKVIAIIHSDFGAASPLSVGFAGRILVAFAHPVVLGYFVLYRLGLTHLASSS